MLKRYLRWGVVGVFLLSCLPVHAASTDWPMIGQNAQGTANNLATPAAMLPPFTLKWLRTDVGYSPGSHPIAYGNNLFLKHGPLYALNRDTGITLWSAAGDNNFETRGVAAAADMVFSLSRSEGKLRAFRISDGSVYASQNIVATVDASPLVIDGSVLYVRANGVLYAYSVPDLNLIWSTPIPTATTFHGSKPMVYNGKVFISTRDSHTMHAFNASTGALIWSHNFGSGLSDMYSLTYAASNAVITETTAGIFSLNADTGAVNWSNAAFSESYQKQIALSGNTVLAYYNTGLGVVNADTGATIWTNENHQVSWGPQEDLPVANGYVYFADLAGVFYVYRISDGVEVYSYSRTGGIGTALSISGTDLFGAEGAWGAVGTFRMVPWTLTGSFSSSVSESGKQVTVTAVSSMLKRDPQASTDNLVQALFTNGDKISLAYDSTSGENTVWKGSYTIPSTTAEGTFSATLEAAAYNTTTSSVAHFTSLPSGFVNSGVTATAALTIDNSAPNAFALTTPSDKSYSNNQLPAFSWELPTDTYSSVAKQALYLDGQLVVDNLSGTITSYTMTTPVSEGTHSWYVQASDEVGHSHQASPVFSFSIDTTVPTGSVSISAPGSTADEVHLALSATDPSSVGANSGISKMMLSDREDFQGAIWQDYAQDIVWKLSTTTRLVYARFQDVAGNVGLAVKTNSELTSLKLISFGTVQFKEGISNWYYTGHRPLFKGTATPGSKVKVIIHSNYIYCEAVADKKSNWSCTPTEIIPNGDHVVTIQAVGTQGTFASLGFNLGINTGLAATGDQTSLWSWLGFMASLFSVLGLYQLFRHEKH